jgi:uncharacterized hydrophobic protein (TIGR00271 family)
MARPVRLDVLRTILVPVANPDTAPMLLNVSAALVHRRAGRILPLFIAVDDADDDAKLRDAILPSIEEMRTQGYDLHLITRASSSVARGILDAARELSVDLIVLGLKPANAKSNGLGPLVEGVMTSAPCDIIIYRPGYETPSQILVPMNGGVGSRAAAVVASRLARTHDIEAEALFVVNDTDLEETATQALDNILRELPETGQMKRTVIRAKVAEEAVVSRAGEETWLVVGVTERQTDFDHWLHGMPAAALAQQGSSLLLTTSLRRANYRPFRARLQKTVGWLRPILTRPEREEILHLTDGSSAVTLDYLILIIVAATIACLGLILNSGAVIIGAMLVAPLMQPLVAIASGLAAAEFRIVRHGLRTLIIGMVAALIVALLVGWFNLGHPPTPEMLNRGRPSLPDIFVALASGVIAAYGMARKNISSALAGVAVAAALVPPWCTFGLALMSGMFDLARSSALLFLVNIISIVLSATLVFGWFGLRRQERTLLVTRVSLAIVVLMGAIATWQVIDLNREIGQRGVLRQVLDSALAPAEVVDVTFRDGTPLEVAITVRYDGELSSASLGLLPGLAAETLREPVVIVVVPQPVMRLP